MATAKGRSTPRFTTRELVYVAIFGAAWGLVETSLGSYLHAARVPFRGAILTAIGLALALCGRALVPRRGTVLMVGVVTAMIKLLNLGGVVLSPLLGILLESLLAELVLWPFPTPRRLAFALAGAVATLWTVFHPFLTQGLLAGSGLVKVYGWLIEGTARFLPFWAGLALLLLASALVIPPLLGAACGLVAYDLGSRLQARLAR